MCFLGLYSIFTPHYMHYNNAYNVDYNSAYCSAYYLQCKGKAK